LLAKIIAAHGIRHPITVSKRSGFVVSGHCRLLAAKELGLERFPADMQDFASEAEELAVLVADNQVAELAETDGQIMADVLVELDQANYPLELTALTEEEIVDYIEGPIDDMAGLTDPDAVPEPPDEAVTQPGDLWSLGNHRLLCGDSGKAEDVDRLLDGATVQLVNTDPPYNVGVAPRSGNAIAASGDRPVGQQGIDIAIRGKKPIHGTKYAQTKKLRPKDRPLVNDSVSDEEFARLLRAWFRNIQGVLEPGRSFYIWGGHSNVCNYPAVLKECGLYFSQTIVWVKEHPGLAGKDFLANHEWCFYGWREGAAHWFNAEITSATDVWSVKKVPPQSKVHLTEKPVELAVRAMTYSSKPGENVLDLFGGSGSTLIAAEKTGRRAFLMEIDPLYCDVIVKRWEEFTGSKAERTSAAIDGE